MSWVLALRARARRGLRLVEESQFVGHVGYRADGLGGRGGVGGLLEL
jgi:hypothetical protein